MNLFEHTFSEEPHPRDVQRGPIIQDPISGGPADDALNGTSGDDVISGFAGADTILGGAGADVVYGHSAGAIGTIASSVFVTGLSLPVAAASTPADPGFLYVVEKDSGVIWRINDATGARTTFLDIPQSEFSRDGERGALGLAFHPDYDTNGRFFIYLTDAQGDIQIREYHRSSNPAVAETGFTLVTEISKQTGFSNHNGGWLGFSPTDGYLYIATGDGGGGGDPSNNAQNLNSLLGKILRLDVDGADAFPTDTSRNYAIPSSNPFVGVTGADEIWAYGVRNPWRNAFDPRNGDFYIADVGQGEREEIDYLAAGVGGTNFGWRIMEGSLPYNPGGPGTPQPGDPSLELPIYEYGRDLGNSITGGEIYVGAATGFVGQYVFADFGSDRVFSLSVDDGDAVHPIERTAQITGAALNSVVDFVTGTDGALYAIGIGGTVWRLTPSAGAEDVGDVLSGGDGNDVIVGGAGADFINGGRDIDASSYALASSAASWHRNPDGSWTVNAGVAGTDALTTVEFLDFTDRDVFLDRAYSTFSGDGTSDVFMQHSTGAMGVWFVNGSGVSGTAGLGALDSTWDLKSVGDFDGDSKDDILIWNDNGALGIWFMNGASVSSAAGLGAIDKASWDIEAIGDLNGDGKDDILLWHDDGSLGAWFMNGASATGVSIGNVNKAAWDVQGLGDLNGDGKDDIVWKDVNGNLGVWFMNGASATGAGLGNIGTAWDVEGLGDFNGDGRDDILMRNDNGSVGVWFMNGAGATGAALGNVSQAFAVAAIGDYNGDGRDDILWWNDNGSLGAWFMNGSSATGLNYGAVSHDWEIDPS